MKMKQILFLSFIAGFVLTFASIKAFAISTNLGTDFDENLFSDSAVDNGDGTYNLTIGNVVYTGSLSGDMFTVNSRTVTENSTYHYTGNDADLNPVNYTGSSTTTLQTIYDTNGREISNTYTQNQYPDPAQDSDDRRNYETTTTMQFNGTIDLKNIVSTSAGSSMDGIFTQTYHEGNLTGFDYLDGFVNYQFYDNGTLKEVHYGGNNAGNSYYFDENGNLVNEVINDSNWNIDDLPNATSFAQEHNWGIPTSVPYLSTKLDSAAILQEILESMDAEAIRRIIEEGVDIPGINVEATSDHSMDFGPFGVTLETTDDETSDTIVVVSLYNMNLVPRITEENAEKLKNYLECYVSDEVIDEEGFTCEDLLSGFEMQTEDYGNWAFQDAYIIAAQMKYEEDQRRGISQQGDSYEEENSVGDNEDNAENINSDNSDFIQKNIRRIYTVKEATEALGKNNRNTFSIKYR